MRDLEVTTPQFTERIAEAERLLANRHASPGLSDSTCDLVTHTLREAHAPLLAAVPLINCCTRKIGAGTLAFDLYVHRLRRDIAAIAAALDGLDAPVFTGGSESTSRRSGRQPQPTSSASWWTRTRTRDQHRW